MKEHETSVVLTCEGKGEAGGMGLDKGRNGNVYMKLLFHFSVFTSHVLGIFMSQI